MAIEKNYYTIDPQGKLKCLKCGVPVCPVCGFVYVPEELALGKVLSVEKALEDK